MQLVSKLSLHEMSVYKKLLTATTTECRSRNKSISKGHLPSSLFYFKSVKKWANPGLFLFIFVFSTVNSIFNIKFCRWLDSNRGSLESEATAQPTEPLPHFSIMSLFVSLCLSIPLTTCIYYCLFASFLISAYLWSTWVSLTFNGPNVAFLFILILFKQHLNR